MRVEESLADGLQKGAEPELVEEGGDVVVGEVPDVDALEIVDVVVGQRLAAQRVDVPGADDVGGAVEDGVPDDPGVVASVVGLAVAGERADDGADAAVDDDGGQDEDVGPGGEVGVPAAGGPADRGGDGVAEEVGVGVGHDREDLREVGLAVLLVAGSSAAADGDARPRGSGRRGGSGARSGRPCRCRCRGRR